MNNGLKAREGVLIDSSDYLSEILWELIDPSLDSSFLWDWSARDRLSNPCALSLGDDSGLFPDYFALSINELLAIE